MKMRNTIATLLALLLALPLCARTHYNPLNKYTEEHPLIVVADRDFEPYEYEDADGSPTGYNMELADMILQRLGVPYRIVMRDWNGVVEAFDNGEADITVQPDENLFRAPYFIGRSALAPCRIAIVYNKKMPKATTLEEIDPDVPVYFLNGSISLGKAKEAGLDTTRFAMVQSSDILKELDKGADGYFISVNLTIRAMMRKEGLENLQVDIMNLYHSTLRFQSHDEDLVDIFDEEYARLEQRGDVQMLQNKWFFPDRNREDVYVTVAYILFVLAVAVSLLAIVLNRIVFVRVKRRTRRNRRAGRMMDAAIRVGKRNIIRFDFNKGVVRNVYGDFLPEDKELTPEEYLNNVHPDDAKKVTEHMKNVHQGDDTGMSVSPSYRFKINNEWHMVVLSSVFEFGADKSITGVISTVSDITEEVRRTRQEEEDNEMFYRIFDNVILGMAIYDPKGELVEANTRMREIFHLTDKAEGSQYYAGQCLFDMLSLIGVFDQNNPQELWICTKIHPGDWKTEKYIELHITPMYGDNDELLFILVAVRDITPDVKAYRQQRIEMDHIAEASVQLRRREEELRLLLNSARMRIWIMAENTDTISFYTAPGQPECTMAFDEFVAHAADAVSMEIARKLVMQDEVTMAKESVTFAMNDFLESYSETQWYSVNVLGIYPDTGDMPGGRFGLIRNCTPSVLTQKKLEKERERAMESEHQKSVFLNSMAHEIRTPLNSIVGFSEVLALLEAEERNVLIDTIKDNCDKLLRLTDDLITISAMDANELTFNLKDVDFAEAFDKEYEHLRIYTDANSMVDYQKDNPYDHLWVRTDVRRISQILTNFLNNAVKYTLQGFIRIGYSYDGEELWIYCQDSGTGISKDKQKNIFDRFMKINSFVQGAGMGLSVCKSIAEAMGGRIGLDSEEGRGSTFYVVIPAVSVKQEQQATDVK